MIDLKNIGQKQADLLRDAYLNKKVAHSYLFVDPMQKKGINTAYWLACLFNCLGEDKPDGTCNNCQRILDGNHPDVFLVKLEGKQTLSIDQIRPLKEELMIALAGPGMQLMFYLFFSNIVIDPVFRHYHILMLLFNLLPVVPLDGSKIANILMNYHYPFLKSYRGMIGLSVITIISTM